MKSFERCLLGGLFVSAFLLGESAYFVSIGIMGMPVCREGLTVASDEDEALRRFENPEITIWADLGAGAGSATVWTCDLTHDYVSINGDYRS